MSFLVYSSFKNRLDSGGSVIISNHFKMVLLKERLI